MKKQYFINGNIIDNECKRIEQSTHPFKLPYIHEDWILGHFSKPEEISIAVSDVFHDKKNLGTLGRKFTELHDWSAISKQMSDIFDSV